MKKKRNEEMKKNPRNIFGEKQKEDALLRQIRSFWESASMKMLVKEGAKLRIRDLLNQHSKMKSEVGTSLSIHLQRTWTCQMLYKEDIATMKSVASYISKHFQYKKK